MSICCHPGLDAQREVIMAAIEEIDTTEWEGGPMDGTVINSWCGLFPQGWLDGLSTGEGDANRSGEL